MASRTIRISSRALGERRRVLVYVYDTTSEMRRAAFRFNGSLLPDAVGVTQAYRRDDLITVPIVRLARSHLGTQVISHEMHHATTGIYGSTLPASDVLTHYNEPFAHLYSDLLHKLVDSLYRFGYYGKKETS